MKDELGDRFKPIEREWRLAVPADQFMVIRIDGKAFHTWTRGLPRPYSQTFLDVMDDTNLALLKEIPGALCGYTQSDEISIIVKPMLEERSQQWFGGAVQKIVSVVASMATANFNYVWNLEGDFRDLAYFDARVFPLPDVASVADYLWWRQSDARRNAVTMMAEGTFGHRALDGVGTLERKEMLAAEGIDLEVSAPRFLNGGLAKHVEEVGTAMNRKTGEVVEFTRRVPGVEPADLLRNWFYDNFIEKFPFTADGVAGEV